MSASDPVEFVRRLDDGDQVQRLGNRIQKEAFEMEADHLAIGAADAAIDIVLANPGAGWHWRFDFLHVSFDGAPISVLTIVSGAVTYTMDVLIPGPFSLPFESTRWASASQVTIELSAAGVGVSGNLAIAGARIERDIYS